MPKRKTTAQPEVFFTTTEKYILSHIRKSTFILRDFDGVNAFFIRDDWSRRGYQRYDLESTHHNEFALNWLVKEEHKELFEKFKKMNTKMGIDPAEFLVSEYGAIGVENGYLIYGNSPSYSILDGLDLVKDFDTENKVVFIRQRSDKELEEIRRGLRSQASYYNNDPMSRFHCPSGFPRQSYLDFRAKCMRYGVDYQPRETRYFTSYC